MSGTRTTKHSLLVGLFILAYFSVEPVNGNSELRALMLIKSSLDPENKYLSSWRSDGDPCISFEGVGCNEHRKVANISLQGKRLTGKLSPAVAELKCLSGLYLHYNSLTGEMPKEIGNLTELTDLYLNMNNLSGGIPHQIGRMASLQVMYLCCNQLTGSIPTEIGSLKKLSVLALENNNLTGQIPPSLVTLEMLKTVKLSFNRLSGSIPAGLAKLPQLEVLDVETNSLSGIVPPGLKRLNGGFHFKNNPGLCGAGFSSLRSCNNAWDAGDVNNVAPFAPEMNNTGPINIPQSGNFSKHCNQTRCTSSSTLRQIGIVAGSTAFAVTLMIAVFIGIICYRRRQQKVGNTSDPFDDRISSTDVMIKGFSGRSPSPLVTLEYSNRWNQMVAEQNCSVACEVLQGSKFNLEEVESATQHFSEMNLLGKSKFSAVYKGILKDGSLVAIKSINVISCKTDEAEFMKGLRLLTSLKHANLVRLKGFYCSKGRGECFLIYNFASKGNLSQYLDKEDDSSCLLDWSTRVSIITGIAKGIEYLHSTEANKPPIVHQNISVEKVLLDQQFTPLLSDSGLLKLLADDVVYSALKVSAALGCMAPEYITTGRFTEKSDVYAFGVIILQILSGKTLVTHSMRLAAESCNFEVFIDPNLKGNFSDSEATKLTKLALACTHEDPDNRPTMASIIKDLSIPGGS